MPRSSASPPRSSVARLPVSADPSYVAVAVPVPLAQPLTWSVPAGLRGLLEPGVRVRVPLGKRRVVGWVVGAAEAPEGVAIRPVEAVLDREPLVSRDLVELAVFVAEYYLGTLGEALRALAPNLDGAWGDRIVQVTTGGLLRDAGQECDREIVARLTESGPVPVGRLLAQLTGGGGLAALDRLEGSGAIRFAQRSGGSYRKGVELAPGEPSALLGMAGRSTKARAVVECLLERQGPMLLAELEVSLGVSPAVVSRLERLGVLRSFTQVERQDLSRHRLAGQGEVVLTLRSEQRAALDELEAALIRHEYAAYLLHGVTGAGKTEVYLRAIEATLAQGRDAIVLVPEIGLVPALARAVRTRFGDATAILHSALGAGERRQEWERIRSGAARVVLGPRSAIFAPVHHLGLVVVDEEQDGAYKQDQSPRYNGRDVALVRARSAGAVAVLASATPSLEAMHNVRQGKIRVLRLRERASGGLLPATTVVDLRREGWAGRPGEVCFSKALLEALTATLDEGGQAVLLRNRRGYAPLLLCRACGEENRCEDCGLPRTVHRRAGTLVCHYCGSTRPRPARCGSCGADALEAIGAGTERVEELLAELLPGVPLAVLDGDVAARPGGVARVLETFSRGEARVLVGTQMVAKGHHFPEVGLAAVLAADSYLGFPDFRAVEKTWALLVQLAGRAGRGSRPGRFLVQSWNPEHYAIRAVVAGDEAAFLAEELRFRQAFSYPPYTRLAALVVTHPKREECERLARSLAAAVLAQGRDDVRLAGPAPAPLERLRGEWRWQLLVRAPSGVVVRRVVAAAVAALGSRHVSVDIDPLDLV